MENKVNLLFAGDFVYSNNLQDKDFKVDEEYKKIIKEHDIFCCNLEGPIINNDYKKIKKIGPNINNNNLAVKKINDLGCNLFCLANNHIFDYGKEGIKNTIDFLEKKKIKYIGAGLTKEQVYLPYIVDINKLKLCFINIAENGFGACIGKEYGYSYAFDKNIKKTIKEYRKNVDFLIIISHMGAEHWDIPLPEVRNFYKELIDCGVDVIIAHHPHVPQGWEEYKGKTIFYSLGNFIFDKGKGIQNPKSYVVSLNLEENKKIEYKIIPTIFDNYTLKIDNTDYKKLASLIENEELYNKLLDEKIMQAYENYKKSYYKVVSHDTGSIKEKIKGFIKRNILRSKFRDDWLYHNINIETHLWICKRATRYVVERNLEEKF